MKSTSDRQLTSEAKYAKRHFRATNRPYGWGVCGTPGMMAGDPSDVNCDRCKRTAVFKAALARPLAKLQKVVRVDQSPLNPQRWCLTLECGHEAWVNSTRKPTRKSASCGRC
jgi:hypothetical protein